MSRPEAVATRRQIIARIKSTRANRFTKKSWRDRAFAQNQTSRTSVSLGAPPAPALLFKEGLAGHFRSLQVGNQHGHPKVSLIEAVGEMIRRFTRASHRQPGKMPGPIKPAVIGGMFVQAEKAIGPASDPTAEVWVTNGLAQALLLAREPQARSMSFPSTAGNSTLARR